MRFLNVGDIHWRASTPRARVDDFAEAQMDKLDQIHDLADEYECAYVIAPGDAFDSATPPFSLVGTILRKIGDHGGWLAVLGQHDQRYHSNAIANTPLGLLQDARAIHILKPKPLVLQNGDNLPTAIYGCSWGEDIPGVEHMDGVCNILVMHRMVIGNAKLWREQEEFTWSRHLLRQHDFDLIVTGDNHHYFTDSVDGRWLINCGSLMRQNIDQVDHKPMVVMYDTDTGDITPMPLKVAPAVKVFDMALGKAAKERNEMLESFVEQVGGSGAPDLDFLATLGKLTKGKGVGKGVVNAVNKIVEMSDGT